jgi:hypothetical protein
MSDPQPDAEPTPPQSDRYTATPPPVVVRRSPEQPGSQAGPSYRPLRYRPRPGSVTAALAITWVLLAVYGYGLSRFVIGTLAEANGTYAGFGSGHLPSEVSGAFRGFALMAGVLLAWAVVAFVLSIFALAGRHWARLALAISGGLSIPLQLSAFWFFLVPLVGGLATVVVIVMLFSSDANDWYDSVARDSRA